MQVRCGRAQRWPARACSPPRQLLACVPFCFPFPDRLQWLQRTMHAQKLNYQPPNTCAPAACARAHALVRACEPTAAARRRSRPAYAIRVRRQFVVEDALEQLMRPGVDLRKRVRGTGGASASRAC